MYAFGIILIILEILCFLYTLIRVIRNKGLQVQDTFGYISALLLAIIVCATGSIVYNPAFINEPLLGFFGGIGFAFKLITLEFEDEFFQILIAGEPLFAYAYMGAMILAVEALSSLLISLFKLAVSNYYRYFKNIYLKRTFTKNKNEFDFIFGFNEDTEKYLSSLNKEEKKNTVIVLNKDEVSYNKDLYKSIKIYLHEAKVPYICLKYDKRGLTKLTTKDDYFNIVSFLKEDDKVYNFANAINEFIQDASEDKKDNIQFIVFMNHEQHVFLKPFIETTKGLVRAYEKAEIVSFIFQRKHNFAKYMRKADCYIFNDDGTINDCDINVHFIGFGSTNQALISDTLMVNQFASKEGKILKSKKIHTYIYDLHETLRSLEVSTGILSYHKKYYEGHEDEYFALPDDYSSDEVLTTRYKTDVGQMDFIKQINDTIQEGRRSFNFFFISYNTDFLNSELGDKLNRFIKHDENIHNFFFVHTRQNVEMLNDKAKGNIFNFGSDEEVFTRENIILNKVFDSAIRRNVFYKKKKLKLTDHLGLGDSFLDRLEARKYWSKLTEIQRDSNVYAILGLPCKLSIMGIDSFYYDDRYFNKMYYGTTSHPEEIKYIYEDYALVKRDGNYTLRDVLCFCEHERWNAFELSKGVKPLKKSEMLKIGENKSKDELKHANVAENYGLIEYHDFILQHNMTIDSDVYIWDYQLLDTIDEYLKLLK